MEAKCPNDPWDFIKGKNEWSEKLIKLKLKSKILISVFKGREGACASFKSSC